MNGKYDTIRELIEGRAAAGPAGIFLISPETGVRVTFGGLQEECVRISSRLGGMGLRAGEKVAFLMDNGVFTAQLFLGVMAGGYVLVPLNSRAGATTLGYTLEHSDAAVVFVEEQYVGLLQEATAGLPRPVAVVLADPEHGLGEEAAVSEQAAIVPGPEDVALLMYTSGSTGKPKAATHTQRTVLAHGANSVAAHQLTAADCSLLVLPLYHINAECVTLLPTLVSGGSVVIPRHFSVSQFWDLLAEHQCTWSAVVPTIISQLLDWKDPRAGSRGALFQRLRFLRSSSAPLSPSLHREFLDKFDVWLMQAMGCSEGGNVFSNPQRPGANKIGSPGLPWGFETRIINPEGQEVAPGESGEVLLRGPALMRGYYKDPEGTATVVDAAGWFHTGDLAYRDAEGYFFVIGRSKELIIKGGVNIAPKQIDEVLESHPSVLEAAAVGVPDRYVGEDVIAFVVLRAGKTGDERELLSYCESRLGPFKTPTRIHFASDLPKGPSGKIQRLKLQEKVAAAAAAAAKNEGAGGEIAPAETRSKPTPIEQTIAGIWMELLKQPHVGLQSNFFSLGGHSLLAIQSLSKLRERLPVTLSLSDFFENATVAQQAALIRKRLRPDAHATLAATVDWEQEILKQIGAPAVAEVIPPRDPAQPCPLSPAQERLWFMEQLNAGVPVYNESEAVRLAGPLNVAALEAALNLIVSRHEILRTTIQIVNGESVAVVQAGWRLKIKRLDLQGLAPAERAVEVERLLVAEPRQAYQLETEPGIRATLVQVGAEEHVFILMMHHIICDWSSEGVLWRELSALYRPLLRGEPAVLPPLPLQHGDYAAWQKQQMAAGGFAADLAYWREKLQGAPALLELPADRPRPGVNSYRGARARYPLGPALVQLTRDCSRDEKISLFTLFTAALDVLLFRYTGSEDISLGIPLADRDRPELQSVIGFLLHTHVLRTQFSGKMTFRELLAQVQKGVLDLYTHRAPPFDQVVNVVHPERNLSYTPLFQVMINWRDRDQQLSFIGLEGLVVKSLLAETHTSKFDLTFMLTDDEPEIWLEIEYNTDLFEAERIGRMVGHYQTLLEGIVANPETVLTELPLLTDGERQQLVVEWNRTERVYPKERCLHELIEAQAQSTPEAMAVVFEQASLTYRELNGRANQLAGHLRKLGVGPDVLVGICVERSLEMVVGLLGILKAGGAYVPMDPEYPRERLAFMLEDARPKVLLTQRRWVESLPTHATQVVELDSDWPAISQLADTAVAGQASPANLAYIIYTSGSTGQPKGVEIPHQAVVNFLQSMRQEPGLKAEDTLLAITTLSFDIAGLELWLPLTTGARLVIAKRETTFDGLALAELLKAHAVTVMQATPSTWHILLSSGWSGQGGLKMLCGGEPWSNDLARQLLEKGASLWNLYGPTETTIWSAGSRVQAGQPVLIGRPIANTQLHILDEHLQPVPVGVPGELHIGGTGLARGYHHRPELTAEKFIASPFRSGAGGRLYKTGDLCRYLADGNVEYLGRLDHQVKLRGFRIELGEIEAQLAAHPAIKEAVVVAREDTAGDKRLVAYMTAQNGELPKAAELRGLLQTKLPDYMVPSAFVTLKQFPRTPNGKLDRKALPQPDAEKIEMGQSYVAPENYVEQVLCNLWREVLKVKRVGIKDNFFDLGGHSLLAIRLINEINKSLKTNLNVPQFFNHPTVEQLARLLNQGKHAEPVPQLIALQPGQSEGAIYFLEAGMGLCRLAELLDTGPASFATLAPLPPGTSQAAHLGQLDKLPHLEELAATHAALIRKHNYPGRCILVGHSFTALLAFEVAHQLQREGRPVEMIFILDTWAALPPWWQRVRVLSFERLMKSLSFRVGRLWQKARAVTGLDPAAKPMQGNPAPSPVSEDANLPFGEASWEILSMLYQKARKHYRLQPLDSRALLFRAQESENAPFYVLDGDMGWGKLFKGGLEVVDCSGDHFTLLKAPHIQFLVEKIETTTRSLNQIPQAK